MSSVVIIGASHAAAEAVSTLNKSGFTGSITLVGDESTLPYQRPPLSKKYLAGEVQAEQLLIRAASVYEQAGVVQKLGRRATSIDRQAKTVVLDNGESLLYDYLILATGTRARKLNISGAEADNIFYLRTIEDVDQIKTALGKQSRLLIVGAGYIGLEVSASALSAGHSVTVLEAMDRVLERVTSPVVSEFYQRRHRQAGVDLRCATTVQAFNHTGTESYAVLDNGEQLAFDVAIIGIGVMPNTELAENAGIDCDNGILVDEFTLTSDSSVYAVGDCCNHPSLLYGRRLRLESVPNAMAQAKTAALHICQQAQVYDQVPWFWSDQYDIKLQTVGLCQGYDDYLLRGSVEQDKFAVFYFQEERLIAVDAINSPAEFMVAKKLVAVKATPDRQQLVDTSIPIKSFL